MRKKGKHDLLISIMDFISSSILNISLIAITVALLYTFTIKAFDYGKKTAGDLVTEKEYREISIVIPDGANQWEVASILKNSGLINNEFLFLVQTSLNGTYDLIMPGEYSLNTNMSTGAIIEQLQVVQEKQSDDNIKLTIREGLTLQQMGELFESKGFFTAEEFIKACNEDIFNYSFVDEIPNRPNRLEGYLFPDTYFFSLEPTTDEVINKMLQRFDDIYSQEIRAKTIEKGLTIDKVVIMGSIIEGEISKPDERPIASAIIYNRLKSDMPLQMCSSIMYALDKRKDRLLLTDLKIQSPYNTYENSGLPIGPISNPGKESIEAALNPADVDYLYFVLKDTKSGEHEFTNDYDVFLKAKEKYNQEF